MPGDAPADEQVEGGRRHEPEDIIGPVVFLASDMARYVTGAAFLADGGLFVTWLEGQAKTFMGEAWQPF